MSLVLDCSATLAFLLDDEHNDHSLPVLKQIAEYGAIVPPLWAFEVGNSLTMAMRRKRINAELRDKALQTLNGFDIQVDQASLDQAWRDTLELADQYRLTVYDAAYLECECTACAWRARRRGSGAGGPTGRCAGAAATCLNGRHDHSRQCEQSCRAFGCAENQLFADCVPSQSRDAALSFDGHAHQQFGGVCQAAQQDAIVLVADRQHQRIGVKRDLRDFGGPHAAFAGRFAHRAVFVFEGPDDRCIGPRCRQPIPVM